MLISLSDMKVFLKIDPADTSQDVFLTAQLNLISDTVEAYCRRRFSVANYSQTFYSVSPTRGGVMELFHYPVIGISSITSDGTPVDPFTYRLHKGTGRVTKWEFPFMFQDSLVINYSAGFIDIPSPILDVVKSLVAERYNKQTSGVALNFGSDVQRVSIPGAISIDFDYSLSNNDRKTPFGVVLGSYVNILDYYRSDRAVLGSEVYEYVDVI